MATTLIVIIVLALIFDYINGFHDAANSIATVVSTKVLTPLQAVLWAALFNFLAFFIFKDHGVANTIAKTVKEGAITLEVIISGLLAAIFWNLLTWWFGIPSSSSHTLIGGFAGAAVAHAGFGSINLDKYPTIFHTAAFILLAPLIGMIMAFLISLWFIHSFSKSVWPKLVSVAVIVATVWFISHVLVTSPSRILGVKSEADSSKIHIVVKELAFNSPAMNMGLKKNDVIQRVDNVDIASAKDFDKLLKRHTYGDPIKYEVLRKGEPKTIETTYQTKYRSTLLQVILFGEDFKWLLLGFIIVSIAVFALYLSSLNLAQSHKWFKRMQLVSSAAFSIGHGGNDAQKVMGIITAALIAGGQIKEFDQMPDWVPFLCYSAIGLGTMSGGWKIIKTMGTRITKVTPFEGVAAETAGAITLFFSENLKIPVSTTHTITGSIIGVGATKRLSAVRWGVTLNLLWAWILTIPVSAAIAAGVYFLLSLFMHH